MVFITIKHGAFGTSINPPLLPPAFRPRHCFCWKLVPCATSVLHPITSSCLYLTHTLHYTSFQTRYYDWLASHSETYFPIKSPDWSKLTTINIHSSHCYHKTPLHTNLTVCSSLSLNYSKWKGLLKGVDLNQKALSLRILFC